MAKIYSYKWTSVNGESFDEVNEDVKKEWIRETLHLDVDGWQRALSRCKSNAVRAARDRTELWPPSYIEFVGYSEPPSPDRDLAYTELMKYMSEPEHRRKPGNLSPMVYHTYTQNLDAYTFRQMSIDEARRAFNVAFRATQAQIELGQPLCEHTEQEALPKPKPTAKSRKIGEKTIETLRAMF
jgi:hypothetical protein